MAPPNQRKKFVLLFDGTGNKFSGTDSDSNILKILRMLDRNETSQVHYYQPGIGTYVQSNTYTHTSKFTRASSWIKKARDAAIGASFDEHVMGGYKFLMRHYQPGDDLYIFGFSRGAYTARYLAEMLDYIGLLEAGNEELARFAWKAFAKWQRRLERTDEEIAEKKKMFKFMKAFRDTFARPVKRIRFLGLFDTVNSVSQFESRWLARSSHPYTATSSAIMVRHAVSIDERRAKFRQDLLTITSPNQNPAATGKETDKKVGDLLDDQYKATANGQLETEVNGHYRANAAPNTQFKKEKPTQSKIGTDAPGRTSLDAPKVNESQVGVTRKKPKEDNRAEFEPRYRRPSAAQIRNKSRDRRASPSRDIKAIVEDDAKSTTSATPSVAPRVMTLDFEELDEDDYEEALPQDVLEVWFAGGHGDIGGGWIPNKDEVLLSHVPLVWMVREAQKSGLKFDPEKVAELNVGWDVGYNDEKNALTTGPFAPAAGVPTFSFSDQDSPEEQTEVNKRKDRFHKHLHRAATESVVHDCLTHGGGLPFSGVMGWSVMEWLPFRRMDLQQDSTWKSIRFPLPRGEVRDMPDNALIHGSVIRRLEGNAGYRPGNLIAGGGGRGVKIAPKHLGTGEWDVACEAGDPVGECWIRKKKISPSVEK